MSTKEAEVEDVPVSDTLALSESSTAKERQEGVIDVLANPDILGRFTNLKRRENKDYAKMVYLLKDIEALEKAEETGEFNHPDFEKHLITPDLDYRVSEGSLLIKVFKSVSHLFEKGGEGGRVGFFGRKG